MRKGNKTWWEQLATGILIIALVVTFSLSGWIGVKARGGFKTESEYDQPLYVCRTE